LGHYIAEEASDAAHVKKMQDIMVVLGNPPYSGHSANKGEWIDGLLREYYFVDGAPLGERNPKWLQDDYVKFIRFGEWRVDKTGHGILAFITNHSYLDNPTFRGMRQHLMTTFDEIYVLDLHGNSKKKEKTPEGGKDENVFDIQQGVAVILAIKTGATHASSLQKAIYHAHLWGLREEKYAALQQGNLNEIKWQKIQPDKPFYLFTPQDKNLRDEYKKSWKITDVFPITSLGVTTARDEFAVAFDKKMIQTRLSEFIDKNKNDNELLQKYGLHDTRDWKIAESRKRLRTQYKDERLRKFSYRPFDNRWTYHDLAILELDRRDVLGHLYFENIGLVTLRRTRSQDNWNFALATEHPTDKSYITSLDNAYVFPLYLYTTPEETAGTLFAQTETTRKANLAPAFIKAMEEKLGMRFVDLTLPFGHPSPTGRGESAAPPSALGKGAGGLGQVFTPEDVFYYAYAVFHNPTYRTRYAEFLKIDFPRLPLTGNRKLFFKLVEKGRELVELHLLKSSKVDDFITTYPEPGSNKVEKAGHAPSPQPLSSPKGAPKGRGGRVWINEKQYFGQVPEEVWNFKVGGYQVCDKWLKDRKGRVLSGEDITHYQRVVVALKETIRLMQEIDKTIPNWPLE
jgi:predicted helicase